VLCNILNQFGKFQLMKCSWKYAYTELIKDLSGMIVSVMLISVAYGHQGHCP